MPLRVVVAEDNPITLRLLTAWLEAAGHRVVPATNGREAAEVLDASSADVLVTDWNMPELSGLDLCRLVRQRNARDYVYVLMATSREDRKDIVQAIDAGADDYVSKPLKEDELVTRVGQAKAALQRFRQHVERAEQDALTGTMNRRRLHEHCVREISKAAREQTHLSCALLDLDLFKHINDTYGHATGDAALQAVANTIREQTRDQDCLCRYGGDEFCLLIPGMDEAGAFGLAERIRQSIAELRIQAGTHEVELRTTVGVAQWREDVMTPRQLIDLADEALLVAKRSGRDCVVSYAGANSLDCIKRDEYYHQLAGVLASEIMNTPIVTLAQDLPLLAAGDLFLRLRINSIPVVDEHSRLIGLISENDVLNAVSAEDHWDRPIREVMKTNVTSFEESTPVTTIWKFLRRVTVRRVVIVRDGIPTGVVSRGTLLRWLGNWGALMPGNVRENGMRHMHTLCNHAAAVATTIEAEVRQLQHDVTHQSGTAVPCIVNAATRLQEQAQDLLSLSQIHYQFAPRRSATLSQPDDTRAVAPANPPRPSATELACLAQEAKQVSVTLEADLSPTT
jgi:diguanylate cyclase (GGDEF)-like protein